MNEQNKKKLNQALQAIAEANKVAENLETLAVEKQLTHKNREVEKYVLAIQKEFVVTDFDNLALKLYEDKQAFLKSLSEEQRKAYEELEALVALQTRLANGMKQR